MTSRHLDGLDASLSASEYQKFDGPLLGLLNFLSDPLKPFTRWVHLGILHYGKHPSIISFLAPCCYWEFIFFFFAPLEDGGGEDAAPSSFWALRM